MAHRLALLPHREMGLVVGITDGVIARRPGLALKRGALLGLLVEIVRLGSPLIQEKLAEFPVFLLPGGLGPNRSAAKSAKRQAAFSSLFFPVA